jgi:quercetin dioxygenase-like cupin family protein
MDAGRVVTLADQVGYQDGAVVSKQLLKNESGSVTLFAFDAGEGLSEHTTPHDALVTVLDGRAEITVAGDTSTVATGEAILMPGGVPHAVFARERFVMSLVMLKRPT